MDSTSLFLCGMNATHTWINAGTMWKLMSVLSSISGCNPRNFEKLKDFCPKFLSWTGWSNTI